MTLKWLQGHVRKFNMAENENNWQKIRFFFYPSQLCHAIFVFYNSYHYQLIITRLQLIELRHKSRYVKIVAYPIAVANALVLMLFSCSSLIPSKISSMILKSNLNYIKHDLLTMLKFVLLTLFFYLFTIWHFLW